MNVLNTIEKTELFILNNFICTSYNIMMKGNNQYLRLKAFVLLVILAGCTSCIQSEPPNPEADILSFALPDDIALANAVINRNDISITVRKDADLTSIVPVIEITEGATISPAIGTPCDLTKAVTYTVTSESGEYKKEYTVMAIAYSFFHFDFEHWERLDSKYQYETPIEYNMEGERVFYWDSGNKGIALYQQHSDPSLYPVHKTNVSISGDYAAEMITLKGPGNILGIVNIPIAAGSLFTGNFNLANVMNNPLSATEFGQSCDEKPLRFTGYYKYKAGTGDYIDPNGHVLPGVKDSCAVYCVFFKTDENTPFLDGVSIRSHPNIVAVAMLPDENRAGTPGDDFAYFDIPFVYSTNEEVDFDKNHYKLAVVLSSSFYGDRYEGVPGSVLIVDDFEIITENQ